MSLRPPSTSPSPSPGPNENSKLSRQSMGPQSRTTSGLAPGSPRLGAGSGARPTSELLGGSGMFQTPEAEALDQWFENLQNYEATLEEMAAASLDVNFKEELSAIEQWFKVLSEAERTAALYSLLQHSTQVQIRFLITVLQQMARSDPMTALLSPAMGSMQNQMEAKLASMSLKSPGLKSGLPASPTARNFSAPLNRQSLALDSSSNFLSPDSATIAAQDAAATLAQQRAKLKASNAAHRISAPVLSTGQDGRNTWGPAMSLSQVAEQQNASQEIVVNAGSRPKSTEFSGSMNSPAPGAVGDSPNIGSWASMVNTPLIPMFQKDRMAPGQNLDAAASKLEEWNASTNAGAPSSVPRMGDPTVHRRKGTINSTNDNGNADDGNAKQSMNGNQHRPQQTQRNASGTLRNNNNNSSNNGNAWQGARSPALSSNRFGGSDDGGAALNIPNGMNGLGMMGVGGFVSPGLGMMNSPNAMSIPGIGMPPMSPFNMNMNMLGAMGLTPEAQLLAAQMAANGFGQQGWMPMQTQQQMQQQGQRGRGPSGTRTPSGGVRSGANSNNGRESNSGAKGEDDVDPAMLEDVPSWLRSLRLHKYTPNFEGVKWREMVMMDEAALEAKGVAALGARRKMLKTFETVRNKMGIEGGPPSAA